MQKRLVSTGAALLAALCLVLTLAGCGGEKPLSKHFPACSPPPCPRCFPWGTAG